MEQITPLLQAGFIAITLLTVVLFYLAANKSKRVLVIIIGWMAIQFAIVQTGFYANTEAMPPRLMLQLAPTLLFILILFLTPSGRRFIDSLNLKQLTLLHTIRIPVEIVLFYLFAAHTIPQIMTFEGRNFDILAGLTAPLIYYFGFVKHKLSQKAILIWNILSLALLINIVSIAVLSANSPFRQFGFKETNIALAHFPFNWLPSVVVPIVLLSHLVAIRRNLFKTNQ